MKAVERLRVSTAPSNIAYLALLFLILCASIEALPTIYRLSHSAMSSGWKTPCYGIRSTRLGELSRMNGMTRFSNFEFPPTDQIVHFRTDDRLQRTQRAKELAPPSFMKRNDPSSTSSMPSYVYLYEVPMEQPLNEPPHVNELYGVLRNF